jgi:hypothetical protein
MAGKARQTKDGISPLKVIINGKIQIVEVGAKAGDKYYTMNLKR